MDVLGWVVAAGSSLLTAVLYPFILHRLKKMDDKRDQAHEDRTKEKAQELAQIQANSEGIKLMLKYMLERYHAEYMIQGFITPDQRRSYSDIYEAYVGLHGNGEGTKMKEEIMNLQIRTDLHPGFSINGASLKPLKIQVVECHKKNNLNSRMRRNEKWQSNMTKNLRNR